MAMSRKEPARLEVFQRVKSGQVTLVKASELLEGSYRQTLRCYKRYLRQGARGLVHKLRGRPSNRRVNASRKKTALRLYREHFFDFGPTLAAEEMLERHGLQVDHETLRRWLLASGQWHKRRRRQKHRARRERKSCVGELLQVDGSPHAWLEDRGERLTLIECVDDATGRTYGRFYPEETTEAVMDCLTRYIEVHGIPRALYVDKDSIYTVNNRPPTALETLSGKEPLTQMGRAAVELGLELILAHSPQAKGRVERVHGTHQDRLVKKLRLEKIATLQAANEYLEAIYWPAYNKKFAREPACSADLHRRVPAGVDLSEVLCLKSLRKVSCDWCVVYGKRVLQIGPGHQSLNLAGQQVEVIEKLDGRLVLKRGRERLSYQELSRRPRPVPAKPVVASGKAFYKPGPDHPYNRQARADAKRRAASGPSPAPASASPRPAPPKSPTPQSSNVTVLTS
jgi:transposase-like protein